MGGTANDTSIWAGGKEIIFAGGTAGNTTLKGGTLEFASGGLTNGLITFGADGGILQLDGSQTFKGTIVDFRAPHAAIR